MGTHNEIFIGCSLHGDSRWFLNLDTKVARLEDVTGLDIDQVKFENSLYDLTRNKNVVWKTLLEEERQLEEMRQCNA